MVIVVNQVNSEFKGFPQKKLQSYKDTKLQAPIFFGGKSYKATKKVTKLCNFVTFEEISKLQRNEDTELQSYRTGILSI